MNGPDNNAKSERMDSIRLVIITLLVITLFLTAVGASWSWFKPLMGNPEVENVTVETANLSIVYNGGPQYSVNNVLPGWSGTKTFTVTNNSDRVAAYNIVWQNITNNFNNKADIVYSMTSTNGGGTLSETPFPNTGTNLPIISSVRIQPGTTQTYTVTMKFINRTSEQNDQGSKVSGKIIINEAPVIQNLADILKKNNPPVNSPTTTPGRQISQTDEGLIKGGNDDYGSPTYYFRGNVQDNYVSFANKTWRIIRINGDESVRMILYGAAGTRTAWNTEVDSSTSSACRTSTYNTAVRWLTYSNSSIKTTLESWYSSNIGNNNTYDSKVITGKYCSDKSHTGNTPTLPFGPYNRLYDTSTAIPQYTCPNSSDIYNLKVGLITADEVAFAGGRRTYNYDYYLVDYSGNYYGFWTMSPSHWYNDPNIVYAFEVNSVGTITSDQVCTSTKNVRPVINLKADVAATLDSDTNPGTSSNPYRIS